MVRMHVRHGVGKVEPATLLQVRGRSGELFGRIRMRKVDDWGLWGGERDSERELYARNLEIGIGSSISGGGSNKREMEAAENTHIEMGHDGRS